MKLLWGYCITACLAAVSLGMETPDTPSSEISSFMTLLDASAVKCSCNSDCPSVTCYTVQGCVYGKCQYVQKPAGSKCPGQSCTNGGVCDDDANDTCNEKAECISAFKPSTTMCRPSSGECDVAEYCSGTSGSCPLDKFAPPTTACTGTCNGGPCDGVDLCDGLGSCVDVYLPSTTVCRAAKGDCDVAETCTGSSGSCPADTFASSSTMCKGASNDGECDSQDYCDGSGKCVDKFKASTVVCREAASKCDVAETCTGKSGKCPTDAFAPCSTTCTGKNNGGDCDDQDYCDGNGNCVDKYKSSTVVCRAAAGQCDVAEMCTGTSSQCPANVFASKSTTCTGSSNGNPCDGQDLCDGNGKCVDIFLPSTTVCRSSKGQCDVAENCTGSSGLCPVDGYASSTTTCTGTCNGNPCDGQDYCDGNGKCIDKYLPATTVCRPAQGQCDVAELCTGTSGVCPTDTFASKTTKCTGTCNGNPCDGQDYCNGNGKCVDNYLPSGTVCGNTSNGPCTIPATCTGDMGFCPPDTYADASTSCTGTSQGHVCDGKDLCDGNGNCVDRYLSGVVCQKPVGYTRPVYCNGKSATCPVSSFLESANLREMTTQDESVSASEQLLVLRSSSPLVLIGLVCAVAVAAAFVTMRSRAGRDSEEATYMELSM